MESEPTFEKIREDGKIVAVEIYVSRPVDLLALVLKVDGTFKENKGGMEFALGYYNLPYCIEGVDSMFQDDQGNEISGIRQAYDEWLKLRGEEFKKKAAEKKKPK